jgi:AraC family transcriptional regulator of arabinose operon
MNRTVLWFPNYELSDGSDWVVNGIGVNDPIDTWLVDRPSGTDDYLFMYFSTPAEIYADGKLQTYPANTFILWSPGSRHTFGNNAQAWNHHWLHCNGTVLQSILSTCRIPYNQPIFCLYPHHHIRALNALYEEICANEQPDWVIIGAILTIWIRELERQMDKSDESAARLPGRLLTVKRYIESNFEQTIPLEKMAAMANLSVSQFSAQFNLHVGLSPISYLKQVRLQRAMHLLQDRNLNVEQIAAQIGINDPFYFSRQFKNQFGYSPTHYRNNGFNA